MVQNYKRVSMQDIADRLQISKNAVSLALNGKPGVSEETRALVFGLARRLNYGQMVVSEKGSKNLLVFIPEYIRNDSHFYNDIYWSVDYHATQRGYNAIMTTVTEEMQAQKVLPPICSEMGFIGYMVIGILNVEYVDFLLRCGISCVSVDHIYYGLGCKSIVTANLEGCYTLTTHVIAMGHTNIGFVGSHQMTSSIYERWCGFQRALVNASIPNNPSFHIVGSSPLSTLLSNAQELAQVLSVMPQLPTAFVCAGDRIAIALIDALKQLKIKVPEEISVVGFDDIEISNYIEPKLTTMHVPRREMGRIAVDFLLREHDRKNTATTLALQPHFVNRDSLTWVL